MKISELIDQSGLILRSRIIKDIEVCAISCNSRHVPANSVFVAVNGTKEDGNRFIDEAVKRGARVIVTENSKFLPVRQAGKILPRKTQETQAASRPVRVSLSGNSKDVSVVIVKNARLALARLAARFYGNPSSKIKTIGITGTNGKTTVSYLLEALLKEAGRCPSVIGTINYRFKERILPSINTTPGPLELQSMLAQMVKENIDYCVMEVSSHALDQERAAGIDFHSAIFTNLTSDHLDYHNTQESYFRSKARLFEGLGPDAFAVINNDDRFGKRLKKLTRAKIITYGIDNGADVIAGDIKYSVSQTEFHASYRKAGMDIKSKLIGRHNLYNLLSVIAWGLEEGISPSTIESAIEGFNLVPGRLERVNFKGDFSVFVDYAHTEDALQNILRALRGVSVKRIIIVFGCGGERDKTKRPKMGRVATELSDYAIVTNDNPRSEDPKGIIRDIEKGIDKNNYCVIQDRFRAIKKAISMSGPGDIVLVAGKGHEEYQILKNKRVPFSDKQAVRACLK